MIADFSIFHVARAPAPLPSVRFSWLRRWLDSRLQEARGVTTFPVSRTVAAVCVGEAHRTPLIDLDYWADSMAATAITVVMSWAGKINEMQGTAERSPFSQDEFGMLIDLPRGGILQIAAALSLASVSPS